MIRLVCFCVLGVLVCARAAPGYGGRHNPVDSTAKGGLKIDGDDEKQGAIHFDQPAIGENKEASEGKVFGGSGGNPNDELHISDVKGAYSNVKGMSNGAGDVGTGHRKPEDDKNEKDAGGVKGKDAINTNFKAESDKGDGDSGKINDKKSEGESSDENKSNENKSDEDSSDENSSEENSNEENSDEENKDDGDNLREKNYNITLVGPVYGLSQNYDKDEKLGANLASEPNKRNEDNLNSGNVDNSDIKNHGSGNDAGDTLDGDRQGIKGNGGEVKDDGESGKLNLDKISANSGGGYSSGRNDEENVKGVGAVKNHGTGSGNVDSDGGIIQSGADQFNKGHQDSTKENGQTDNDRKIVGNIDVGKTISIGSGSGGKEEAHPVTKTTHGQENNDDGKHDHADHGHGNHDEGRHDHGNHNHGNHDHSNHHHGNHDHGNHNDGKHDHNHGHSNHDDHKRNDGYNGHQDNKSDADDHKEHSSGNGEFNNGHESGVNLGGSTGAGYGGSGMLKTGYHHKGGYGR